MKLWNVRFKAAIATCIVIIIVIAVQIQPALAQGSTSQTPIPTPTMPPLPEPIPLSKELQPSASQQPNAQSVQADFPMPDGSYLEPSEKCSVDASEPDARVTISNRGNVLDYHETQCTRGDMRISGDRFEVSWQCEKGGGFRTTLKQVIERAGAFWKFGLEGEGISLPSATRQICPVISERPNVAAQPKAAQQPNAPSAQTQSSAPAPTSAQPRSKWTDEQIEGFNELAQILSGHIHACFGGSNSGIKAATITVKNNGELLDFSVATAADGGPWRDRVVAAVRKCAPFKLPPTYSSDPRASSWRIPLNLDPQTQKIVLDRNRLHIAAVEVLKTETPAAQLPPPSISPPSPPRINLQQAASSALPSSDFPMSDGIYLPSNAGCQIRDPEEMEHGTDPRLTISQNSTELGLGDYACKRLSYGLNSEGVSVVWKCDIEGGKETIYQTVRPKGSAFEIKQWVNQIRGQPSTGTYEFCKTITILKQQEASAPPKPDIKTSHYSDWRIEHDRKNEKISLFSDKARASVVCYEKGPNVEFYFDNNTAMYPKVEIRLPQRGTKRSIEYRWQALDSLGFQLMKNDPGIRFLQEATINVSSERSSSTYTFGRVGTLFRDICASNIRGELKPTLDTDAALWGADTPKWVELVRQASLRPSSRVLRLCRDLANKQNFPRDHVVAHVRACFIREMEPRSLDQGLKAFQRDLIACYPRVGPINPIKFNECMDKKLTDLPVPAPQQAMSSCDEKYLRANAIFIRAITFCKKNYMDSKAGYFALTKSKQCNSQPESVLVSKIKSAMGELDMVVKRHGESSACEWVDAVEQNILHSIR